MATKSPFDMTKMMKMFDPEEVAKVFNPKNMYSVFEAETFSPFDVTKVVEANKKNFDAMVEANKAAAGAYQDMMEKQMELFGQMTAAAKEQAAWIEENAGPEAMTKKAEAYAEATEKALGLMRKMAETTREANEEAYEKLKGQMQDAMEEMQQRFKK